MQREKEDTSSSSCSAEEEEAGSSKQTDDSTKEEKLSKLLKRVRRRRPISVTPKFFKVSLKNRVIKQRNSPGLENLGDFSHACSDVVHETNQDLLPTYVLAGSSSDFRESSGTMCPDPSVEPIESVYGGYMTKPQPGHTRGPVFASSSSPHIQLQTKGYTDDQFNPRLVKGLDKRLISQPNLSSTLRPRGCFGGQNKNWTDPDRPHSSSALSPPEKRIRLQPSDEILTANLGSSGSAYQSENLRTGFNHSSIFAGKESLEHLPRQQTQDEPAEHPLSADSSLRQVIELLLQGTSKSVSSGSSVLSCDSGYISNFKSSDSIQGFHDFSSDLQSSSTVTEGSRHADGSSVHSESESGDDIDADVKLGAAVSCSLTNTQPTQIQNLSSGPSWTKGLSGSLPRSHSSPSLSHMTSAENKTLTRAQSLPDLQLNSSCEQFTPDITADEDHETYRFLCSSPGLYQCSVTGLVFHMEREGDVVYRTVPWNRKLLSQHHKQPAGPLFDIKCEQQSVCQLHLPHCEILSTGGANFLSVAHLNEEGIEFILPHKITKTHVIINITGFSAFGNVKDEDSPPAPVRGMVLVFYRPPADPDPTSLLNVLLLPRNVSIQDVVRYRKKLVGDEHYIEKPSDCKLHPQQDYTLSTCPEDDSVLVEPTTAEFDSDHYDNFLPSFQVTLEKTTSHLKLILRDTKSSNSVWERRVCCSVSGVQRSCGQSALNLPPNKRLFEIRSSFIAGASGPVLKSLMDKLLENTVMTDSERESVDEMRNRADKARFVIDTVRGKGEAASSEMIKALCDLDPFFSEHLGLM